MLRANRLALAAVLMCLCVAFTSQVQAQTVSSKTVAIIFDTSGSMESRFRLPSFGMRLLAASVDGRAGFDRLFLMNFNDYANAVGDAIADEPMSTGGVALSLQNLIAQLPAQTIREVAVTNGGDHQSLVDSLERQFRSVNNMGTPYGPIEVMLDRLASRLEENEEAVLVLVSDGAYGDDAYFSGGRLEPRMRRVFEDYRIRFQQKSATLRVEYLFIDQLGGSDLRATVAEQKVRDTLLEVFNGDSRTGSHYVSSEGELWEALKDIVAQVSGTDRADQANYVTYAGNTISVDSPLSISRVVIVSTGLRSSGVASLESSDFPVQPSDERLVSTSMSIGDQAFGTPAPPPRSGQVQHLWYQNAIPPGQYTMTFDRPVDRDVFMLFETRSIADLRIFDSDGTELKPEADGSYTLFENEGYQLESRILDNPKAPTPVDFGALPASLTMQLTLNDGNAASVEFMDLDRAQNVGVFQWNNPETGEYTAFTKASAGILSPKSAPLRLRVLSATAAISVSDIRPSTTCTACTADILDSTALPAAGAERVADFDVSVDAALDGAVDLSDTVVPEGFELRDQNGDPIDLNAPIEMSAQDTLTLELWRSGPIDDAVIARGLQSLDVVVKPSGPWTGQTVQQQTKVRLSPPEMGLRLVNVTLPITAGQIDGLRTPGGELLRGEYITEFSMTDLLSAPDPEAVDDLVTISMSGAFARLIGTRASFPPPSQTGFNALEVKPSTNFWCLCWLWGTNLVTGTDTRDMTVAYAYVVDGVVLQQASTKVPMQFPIETTQASLSCLLNLLYALLAWMFVRGIWALITTHRFPRGSLMEITEGRNPPRYKRLDKGNSVWWKAWFSAFTGNPDEVRLIEGLRIRATAKGGYVDLKQGVPPWRVERLDASFMELKETQPRKTGHRVIWGDRFESTISPALNMFLKRKRGE